MSWMKTLVLTLLFKNLSQFMSSVTELELKFIALGKFIDVWNV